MSELIFPAGSLEALSHLRDLFGCNDDTILKTWGGGRLAAIRYDRKLDILTLVGEEPEKEVDQ